jgi:hypothetical protein
MSRNQYEKALWDKARVTPSWQKDSALIALRHTCYARANNHTNNGANRNANPFANPNANGLLASAANHSATSMLIPL